MSTTRIYKNAELFTEKGFVKGGFTVEGNVFGEVFQGDGPAGSSVDLGGARVIPGLVDVHIHGAMNSDFSDGDPAAFFGKCGCAFQFRRYINDPYQTAAAVIQFLKSFIIRKLQIGSVLGTLFLFREKRAFHMDPHQSGAALFRMIIKFPGNSKCFGKHLIRKRHGCRSK